MIREQSQMNWSQQFEYILSGTLWCFIHNEKAYGHRKSVQTAEHGPSVATKGEWLGMMVSELVCCAMHLVEEISLEVWSRRCKLEWN